MHLDTAKCFIDDTDGYKEAMWTDEYGLGIVPSKLDPDSLSRTLWYYQCLLYRRELPNGKYFDLKFYRKSKKIDLKHPDPLPECLKWGNMRFSNDSIVASHRYPSRFPLIHEIAKQPDYRQNIEKYLRESYTIGGEMLFPVTKPSVNTARGGNNTIFDRFDLTLECIKAFYSNEKGLPDGYMAVINAMRLSEDFFRMFNSFEGYVDFFLLQDYVEDGDVVRFLDYDGKPKNEGDYNRYMLKQMKCLRERNARIAELDLKEWKIEWAD